MGNIDIRMTIIISSIFIIMVIILVCIKPKSPNPNSEPYIKIEKEIYWLIDPIQNKRWRIYIGGSSIVIIPNTEESIPIEK